MTDEQKAAYVNSQSAAAMIEAMGMAAANQQRLAVGHSIAYDEQAFQDVINRYGIHHNAVCTTFHG